MDHREHRATIRRRGAPFGACLLVAILAWTVCPAADGSLDQPARVFIDESLRGIGAERIACPADVVEQVRSHRMNAICARFEGSFKRFEVRWGLQMIQAAGPEDRESVTGRTPVSPQTDWESTGAIHDRIYLVGERAIGVRFAAGDVLMVW
jgi:hypothetical protein